GQICDLGLLDVVFTIVFCIHSVCLLMSKVCCFPERLTRAHFVKAQARCKNYPGLIRFSRPLMVPEDASPRQRATETSISPIDFQTTSGEMLSPAARAWAVSRCVPRARGLALGYMLAPAARACGWLKDERRSSKDALAERCQACDLRFAGILWEPN